jgi:hypothetical protein
MQKPGDLMAAVALLWSFTVLHFSFINRLLDRLPSISPGTRNCLISRHLPRAG